MVAPTILLLLFIPFWLLVTGLIAVLGGWTSLAESYPAPDEFPLDPAQRFRLRSMQLRSTSRVRANYGGSMTVGITPQGLYLVPFGLLRFRHTPVLIPWAAITQCTDGSFLWSRWVDLILRQDELVIRLYGSIGEAAWGQWRSIVRK